ncbi:MAG TPA: hypothetical protein EYQ67_07855 [Dehalococcoidia bacterium]|jgi:hypothetical protein|nr:hypothetical protein [Dehalococcoidia bacterium]
MMSRWIVPQDDTHTMLLEFRHISVTDESTPAWWSDREQMLPAQLPITENLEDQHGSRRIMKRRFPKDLLRFTT